MGTKIISGNLEVLGNISKNGVEVQEKITSTNKLNADLVDDSSSTHKFITEGELSKLSGIQAGAEVNVNADWNASSGDAQILNKPSLATVATSGDYNDLINKPTIPTDTNQKIKQGNVTFGNDDVVGFVDGGHVTITGDSSAKTMTLGVESGYSIPSNSDQTSWTNKQDALQTQTAYTTKGSATKVPQITTNSLGQVTGITEVTITQPSVYDGTLTIQKNGTTVATFTANQSTNATANISVPTTLDEISDGSSRKLSNYLPLSGGTMSGKLDIEATLSQPGNMPSLAISYDNNNGGADLGDAGLNMIKFGTIDNYIGQVPATRSPNGKKSFAFHTAMTTSNDSEFLWMSSGWAAEMTLGEGGLTLYRNKPVNAHQFVENGTALSSKYVGFDSTTSRATVDATNNSPHFYNLENNTLISGYGDYWYVLNMGHYSGNNYASQIAMNYQDSISDTDLFIRTAYDGTWRSWRRVLTDSNFSSYALSLINGGTITGATTFNTNTNTTPLVISRTGSRDNECVALGIDDEYFYNTYTNDETSSAIRWTLINTDTEGSDGSRASSHYMQFGSSNYGATLTVDGNVSASGSVSSSTLTLSNNGITTTLGSNNSSWFHIQTGNSVPVYFGESISVNGNIELYGTNYSINSSTGFFNGTAAGSDWSSALASSSTAASGNVRYNNSTGAMTIHSTGSEEKIDFGNSQRRVQQVAGSTLTRYNNATVALPTGSSTIGMAMVADEGGDFGLLYIGSDGAVLANSGDNGYVFKIYDKDQNGSNYTVDTGLLLGVKQGGAGVEIPQGALSVASIVNLGVNNGIYWNPYVESSSDGSDAASITVLSSGAAGGTELRIQQANDSNDIINLVSPYYIYMNSKKAFSIYDNWLRINESADFTGGTYFGQTIVRTDYRFEIGDNGNKFAANSSGQVYADASVQVKNCKMQYNTSEDCLDFIFS